MSLELHWVPVQPIMLKVIIISLTTEVFPEFGYQWNTGQGLGSDRSTGEVF